MLDKSDFPVVDALKLLTQYGLEVTFLVPTPTGLDKSIMDATGLVREYLATQKYHDFSIQEQGPDFKIIRKAFFVLPDGLKESNISLYRPQTKKGDPRIWLGMLTKKFVTPYNLLALTVIKDQLFVLNMSDSGVRGLLQDPTSHFRKIIEDSQENTQAVVDELLGKLSEISQRGFIQTLRAGDTGVGMTLETLLGIQANSRREPDYKGIELKAKRHRGISKENRSTLFSKVPNWHLSPIGNAKNFLEKRGYIGEKDRIQIYQTLNGYSLNSLNLKLDVNEEREWLEQVFVNPETGEKEHDLTWELPVLKKALGEKHKDTFWVHAQCCGKGKEEKFHYVEVKHTNKPLVGNFPVLLETGIITLDVLMYLKSNGKVRDHGYLFKIHPNDMDSLFPPAKIYKL